MDPTPPAATIAPTFPEWLADYRAKEQATRDCLARFGAIRDCRSNHIYHKPGDSTGFIKTSGGGGAELKYSPNGVNP